MDARKELTTAPKMAGNGLRNPRTFGDEPAENGLQCAVLEYNRLFLGYEVQRVALKARLGELLRPRAARAQTVLVAWGQN